MNKHVLFYSSYCQFSRDVVAIINAKNLRELFVLVGVDKVNARLPDFVDRVPLIFTVDRRILTDDAVFAFVESLAQYLASLKPGAISGVSGGAASEEDISPWSTLEMGSRGISDVFSFLEPGSDGSAHYGHNFVDVSHNPTIYTPADSESTQAGAGASANSGKHGSKGTMPSLESFMAMRDNDLKPFMQPRAPVT